MISDEKRREVARKLREPKESLLAYPDDELIRLRRETGCPRGQDFYEHLADLIDRPTCHIRETDHEFEDSVRCDRCRTTFNRPWEPFKYCPNCGAEVLDEDGTN